MDAALLSCVLRDSFMSPASLATPRGARHRLCCPPSPQRIRVTSATRCDACSAMNPLKYPSPLSVARAAARVGLLLLSVGLLLPASHCAPVPPPPGAAAQPVVATAIDNGLTITNATAATSPDANTTTAKPPSGAAGGNPPIETLKNGDGEKKSLINPPPADLPKKPAPGEKAPEVAAPEAPKIAVDPPKTASDGKTTTPTTTTPTTTATSTTLPTTSRPTTTPAKAVPVDGKITAEDTNQMKPPNIAPHHPPAGDDEKDAEGDPEEKKILMGEEPFPDPGDTADEEHEEMGGRNRDGNIHGVEARGKEPAAPRRSAAAEDDGQNHAFGYFVVVLVGCVAVIAFWRKRQRILAYLIEGRRSNGRRRTASRTGAASVQYRKLKTADED